MNSVRAKLAALAALLLTLLVSASAFAAGNFTI